MTASALVSNEDHLATITAIGTLAYLSADVAHHAIGHGGACLVSGGAINLLSSIFVDCSLRGAAIDLAGPFANLCVGLIALLFAIKTSRFNLKLFWLLTTAFNLFWFEMQTAFSVITRTDDWAWAIQQHHIGDVWRYLIAALSLLSYRFTIRLIGANISRLSLSASRARRIMLTSWIAAGLLATLTALFDHHPVNALLHYALPQSMLLSLGLLFVPRYIRPFPESANPGETIQCSKAWIIAAMPIVLVSIALLGPGISFTTQ